LHNKKHCGSTASHYDIECSSNLFRSLIQEFSMKHICIYGVGGVGGYFGGKIARMTTDTNADAKVFFIARGDHLKEIKKNGLILNTDDESGIICKPALATENVSDVPKIDLCLLCVKSYDINNAVVSLSSVIDDNTVIIPLLNGVDVTERIKSITTKGIVLPACVYVGTHIEKPGMVTQKGGSCTIFFGHDPVEKNFDPQPIFQLFDKSNIKYKWSDNPYIAIWEKFMFISPFGLVTAAFNKTIGEVMQSQELISYIRSIAKELSQIAIKKNIPLPDNIVELSISKGNNFPFETRTSFQRDVEQTGKNNEHDLFGGTVIRYGKQFGIPTPVTEQIYSKIKKN